MREPEAFERAMRLIAFRAATRGPCPQTGREHVIPEAARERLAVFGGSCRCSVCFMELRLIARPRIDLALKMVDTARVWAGLPRFTEMQRVWLRAVLGGRDPIVTAMTETGLAYEWADDDEVPDPIR